MHTSSTCVLGISWIASADSLVSCDTAVCNSGCLAGHFTLCFAVQFFDCRITISCVCYLISVSCFHVFDALNCLLIVIIGYLFSPLGIGFLLQDFHLLESPLF